MRKLLRVGEKAKLRSRAAEICPMATVLHSYGLYSYGLYSYGLYSYGLYSYGLYSYGLYSYGLYSYGWGVLPNNLATVLTPAASLPRR